MLRLLPYSIDINWSVMFTGGHPIVTFLWYGCDVCASKYVMCARFQTLWLSDQKWFWLVWFCCVVCWSCLNIPVHSVVYAWILEQVLHIMRETKNLWVTGAAHKPCKAWGKNHQCYLWCQIACLWHELLIRLAWALTLLTCTLGATGLNLRQDTIWSGWLFCDSPQYLQRNTLKYVMTALYHAPSNHLLGLIIPFSDTVFTQI